MLDHRQESRKTDRKSEARVSLSSSIRLLCTFIHTKSVIMLQDVAQEHFNRQQPRPQTVPMPQQTVYLQSSTLLSVLFNISDT